MTDKLFDLAAMRTAFPPHVMRGPRDNVQSYIDRRTAHLSPERKEHFNRGTTITKSRTPGLMEFTVTEQWMEDLLAI